MQIASTDGLYASFNESMTLSTLNDNIYSIDIPKNWTDTRIIYNEEYNITYHSFKIKDEKVAYIEYFYGGEYGITAESFVANVLGMHAYIDGDVVEKDFNGYKRIQVSVLYEQLLGDSGIFLYPELHYLFVKDNSYVDVCIDPRFTNYVICDKIAESFVFKSN